MTAAGVGEKLRAIAQELREHPERWTQKTWARDANGTSMVHSLAGDPVAWCAWGLCHRDDIELAIPLLNRAVGDHVQTWNDDPHRTAAEVAAAFDRAAQLAEASP
jgi:hypothetical protein